MKVLSAVAGRENVDAGLRGKCQCFGLLKRGGRVYTKAPPDTKAKTLMGIMQDRIVPDSIVYTDTYRSYNVLDVSEFKHYRINSCSAFWEEAQTHQRNRKFLEPGEAAFT
jgi:transposase